MSEEGYKTDDGKRRWDLLPIAEVEQVVSVLTKGLIKYPPDNWKKVPDARDRYYAAALRHLTAWRKGEILDRETGEPHLAHATCCLLFLMWFDNEPADDEEEVSFEESLARMRRANHEAAVRHVDQIHETTSGAGVPWPPTEVTAEKVLAQAVVAGRDQQPIRSGTVWAWRADGPQDYVSFRLPELVWVVAHTNNGQVTFRSVIYGSQYTLPAWRFHNYYEPKAFACLIDWDELEVTLFVDDTRLEHTQHPVRVTRAQGVIEVYINGDLSFWRHDSAESKNDVVQFIWNWAWNYYPYLRGRAHEPFKLYLETP